MTHWQTKFLKPASVFCKYPSQNKTTLIMNQKNLIIIKDLKEMLLKKFDFVSEIILFGSQASGEASEGSDYDILIIVNHNISWQQKRKIVDEIFLIDLKYNILTDVKVISKPELNTLKGKQPFIQKAIQEGIVA
jgi:predicted nucleotidyltransferase